MKLLTKTFKYSLTSTILISSILFTGCSQREPSYSPNINKFYKNTQNTKIRNSKAMHRATLKPYTVFGVRYYPKVVDLNSELRGIASWYGPKFHAKKTSNGETYNMYAMTAAHKTLPMNTMVSVLNLENGKSAIVRINDRGPFVRGRIIDLSNSAAHKIDMVRKGTANVVVKVLGYNGEIQNNNSPYKQLPTYSKKTTASIGKKVEKVEPIEPLDIKEKTIIADNYSLQLGAFSRLEGAQQIQSQYKSSLSSSNKVVIEKIFTNDRYLYKVFIKGFNTYNQAQVFKDSNAISNAIIIGK